MVWSANNDHLKEFCSHKNGLLIFMLHVLESKCGKMMNAHNKIIDQSKKFL